MTDVRGATPDLHERVRNWLPRSTQDTHDLIRDLGAQLTLQIDLSESVAKVLIEEREAHAETKRERDEKREAYLDAVRWGRRRFEEAEALLTHVSALRGALVECAEDAHAYGLISKHADPYSEGWRRADFKHCPNSMCVAARKALEDGKGAAPESSKWPTANEQVLTREGDHVMDSADLGEGERQ